MARLTLLSNHVDRACPLDLAGSAIAAGLQNRVRVPGIGEATEAEQAVAEHLSVRRQVARLPVLDAVVVEAAHRFDDRVGWVFERRIGLHRDQERLLVLGATARFAAVALAADVGIIDLHEARQPARRLAHLRLPCFARVHAESTNMAGQGMVRSDDCAGHPRR